VEQSDLLKFAVRQLERIATPYALVGSFASGIWGESRFTQDIDLLIDLKPQQAKQLFDSFPAEDFYVSLAAVNDAVARCGQFNVIHPASGNKIDFMIAGNSSWTAAQLARRKRVQVLPDLAADVAAPEDVILGKLVYFKEGASDKHLRDIAGILTAGAEAVDRSYIEQHAADLKVLNEWRAVLKRVADEQ
jgi:hypothetical protein